MNVKSQSFLRTISRAAVFAAVLVLGALATAPLQAAIVVGTPTGTYSDPAGNIELIAKDSKGTHHFIDNPTNQRTKVSGTLRRAVRSWTPASVPHL